MNKVGLCFALSVALCAGVFAVESFPYHESFERGAGRWVLIPNTDGRTWERNTGGTGSYNTGPNEAHDRQYYMYTEASAYYDGFPNKTFVMEGAFDLSSLASPMVSLRYHMYGSTIGSLAIQASTDGAEWTTLRTISGQQHGSEEAEWTRVEVSLSSFPMASARIRIVGTTGSSFTADICIDDIWVYDGRTMPASFDWAAIEDRQSEGESFPVEITARGAGGQILTGFNGPVELTAWSDGFDDACRNGDFDGGTTAFWAPYAGASSRGPYDIMDSVYGSGKAVSFLPDAEFDGLSQTIQVRGGERYYVTARYCLKNTHSTIDYSGTFVAKILINGQQVAMGTISRVINESQSSYYLWGYFDVPEAEQEGTRVVSIIASTGASANSYLRSYFDDVSINFAPKGYLMVSPGLSGDFVNGRWSGHVAMNYRMPAIKLIARYRDAIGESGAFTTYVSAFDMDGDGLLDEWEEDYFVSAEACVGSEDPDRDGYSTADEFIIGSNPVLKDSCLGFKTSVSKEGECVLHWFSAEDRSYDIQWTPNLQYIAFKDITNGVPYPSGSFTNDMSGTSEAGFYKIKVRKN